MAIDIRATVTCSLGTLISASINDDYVQGTGLIKTKGSAEIRGTITPAPGTVVTFSYTKAGQQFTLPRKLRVLSSFADPYRRTTSVELGCKLTYLQDLAERVSWRPLDDPANSSRTEEEQRIVTIPISGYSIAQKCLSELGITASSNPINLSFSIPSFDFSAGYASILSDLLVSMSHCGYLDTSEQLQVFSLNQKGGTGPVVDAGSIIDLAPVGVGQLPADAVVVSYSTLKLKYDEGEEKPADADPNDPVVEEQAVKNRNWERDETIGAVTLVRIPNPLAGTTLGLGIGPGPAPYLAAESFDYAYSPRSVTETTYDELDRVAKRVTTEYTILADVAPMLIVHLANRETEDSNVKRGVTAPGIGSSQYFIRTTETFTYRVSQYEPRQADGKPPKDYETVDNRSVVVEEPLIKLAASTSIYDKAYDAGVYFDWKLSNPEVYEDSSNLFVAEKTVERQEQSVDFEGAQVTKTIRELSKANGYTQRGQQALASAFDKAKLFDFVSESGTEKESTGLAEKMLLKAADLTPDGVEVNITTGRELGLQKRPEPVERNNAKDAADTGNPLDNYRTESTSELAFAYGELSAQRVIRMTPPYVSDDRFTKSGNKYYAFPSNARSTARLYGETQNRLLLGNRYGMNVQTGPDILPAAPFSPVIISANGLSALYRTNGTSWAISADGIVVSSDLLFWGAVAGTGTFWFPVAPGITTLPTAPAVVNGQMTVTAVVPPWGVTESLQAVVKSKMLVTAYGYALTQLSVVPLSVRSKMTVLATSSIQIPAASVAISASAPYVALTTVVVVPAAAITVAAQLPEVGTSVVVNTPAASIAISVSVPSLQAGGVDLLAPTAAVVVAAVTPSLSVGTSGSAGGDGSAFWRDWAYREDGVLLFADEETIQGSSQMPWRTWVWSEDGAALLSDE
jgi:hypothetical protein